MVSAASPRARTIWPPAVTRPEENDVPFNPNPGTEAIPGIETAREAWLQ